MSAGCPPPTAAQTGVPRRQSECVRIAASLPLRARLQVFNRSSVCVCVFGDSLYLACAHHNSRLGVVRCVSLQRRRDPASLTCTVLARPVQPSCVCWSLCMWSGSKSGPGPRVQGLSALSVPRLLQPQRNKVLCINALGFLSGKRQLNNRDITKESSRACFLLFVSAAGLL